MSSILPPCARPVLYAAMLSVALALASCAGKPPPPKPKAKVEKPHYSAGDMVENLSLSRLSMASDASPTANLEILKSYNSQKKTPTVRQTILLVDYTRNDTRQAQQLIAPVSKNGDFQNLLTVMQALDQTPNTLHNIRILSSYIGPVKAFKLPADSAEIRPMLDERQQDIIDKAQELSALDNAKLQLQLIGFFIENRFRDAAYLCVDNMKQSLAKATQTQSIAPDTLKDLSQQLEGQEARLHQSLPFSL